MRSKVLGCACTSVRHFVIDVEGILWTWKDNSLKRDRIVNEDTEFTSVVADNDTVALLDVSGRVWSSKLNNIHLKKHPTLEGMTSLALQKRYGYASVICTLDQLGNLYYDGKRVTSGTELPEFEYISCNTLGTALDVNGKIWIWGSDFEPSMIPTEEIQAIDMITEETVVKFIDTNGQLWKYSDEEKKVSIMFSNAPPFRLLYGSGRHGFALGEDGELWGWGQNTYKQLGIPAHFVPVPVVIPSEKKWKFISCSYSSSLLISQEGEVYEWGRRGKAHIKEVGIAFVDRIVAKSARK